MKTFIEDVDRDVQPNDGAAGGLLLGRQPILDSAQAVIGYEFLFRPTAAVPIVVPNAGAVATADVVCNAFAELGLARVLGNQLAFIPIDVDFLCHDAIQLLPAESVVLELDAGCEMTSESLERCRELNGAGYVFALAGCTSLNDALHPLATVARYAKVDIEGSDASVLQGLVGRLKTLCACN